MRCFKVNRSWPFVVERSLPSGHTDAPFIARLQTGEPPLRAGRDQIVSVEHRKVEKFLVYLDANGVLSNVVRTGSTVAVAVKTGEGVATTTFQFGAKDIGRHEKMVIAQSSFVIPSAVEESLTIAGLES